MDIVQHLEIIVFQMAKAAVLVKHHRAIRLIVAQV
jgi:hypothetical protein